MAESTRAKTNLDHLEDVVAKLTTNQLSLSAKINELVQLFAVMESSQHSPASSSAHPPSPSPPAHPYRLKLEVLRFEGTDPVGWIFKINLFFDYHATLEPERLTIASFYLDGPTLAWFPWMMRNGQLPSWQGFLQALEAHFASSHYEDPMGSLFKLTQQGTVNEYLTKFEALENRIIGLPPSFLLSCFISGQSSEIHQEVQASHPLSIIHAAALACL